jgi:pimeloyl-ACP methyl ester carboxylesterase
MRCRSLFISRADDVVLHVRQWHAGTNGVKRPPACLLIHGFGDGSFVWDEFASAIAPQYDTYAIDLRGHGDSSWDPHRHYHMTVHVHDIVHVIRALELGPLTLVGHSMGGRAILQVCAACDVEVLGLVIVDSGPNLDRAGFDQVYENFRAANRIYQSTFDYAEHLRATRPLSDARTLKSIVSGALRLQVDGSYRIKADPAMAETQPEEDPSDACGWDLLETLTLPVLLVRGEGSAVFPRQTANSMAKLLRSGRFCSVPLAGHAVMTDNPDGFADAVRPFLWDLLVRAKG